MNYSFLLCLLLLCIPGCRHVNVSRECNTIKQNTKKLYGTDVIWKSTEHSPTISNENIEQRLSKGLSKKESVSLALQRNSSLQAAFEELGIAKSDLLQAGFFSNPHISSVFHLPEVGRRTNIETDATIKISDFWQVPLRKQVSQDTVEIVSLFILQTIMDIIFQTKIAYDTCLYEKQQIEVTQDIINKVTELYERVVLRQQFGFTSDYDKYITSIELNKWHVALLQHQTAFAQAITELRRMIGINVNAIPLYLADTLEYSLTNDRSLEALLETAFQNRPEVPIARFKIQQAYHTRSLEKSRIFDDVEFGLSYKREFEFAKGWGPSLGLSLPIFDTNKGNILRTEFLIQQAKANYQAEKQKITKEVVDTHTQTINALQQIDLFTQKILPTAHDAISYAQTYFDRMQLSMIVLLDSQIKLYKLQKELIHEMFNAAQAKNKLERAIGMSLDILEPQKQLTKVTFKRSKPGKAIG